MPFSCKINEIFSIDFFEELTNESKMKTIYPFSRSKRQVWEPINPDPPVTSIEFKIFFFYLKLFQS